ncbi:serine/threonine protein kinase [Streptomyces sp. SW4]|nr:serine/threonine protein kinase [Streptomyces sp. SW4]
MTHATEAFQPLQTDDPPMVGGYRLAARLGAGGMGRVYLSHTQGGRPVAIKVVRPELADDPGFRRRFSREIKAARRVKGAYTAELIDADGDGVPPWLATLYVPGPSLTQAVDRNGPLPVPAVLWLMAGVAEALQAIHGAGIVHRDLKPSNVLLAADGPRVIDFGIAVAADGTAHTATGAAIGTPQFMAPEQASGSGDVTAATDVFALGQTAAFAALGRPLYGDGPSVSVLYRIVHSEPDLTRLPEPLREPIGRCLAADPAKRITPAEVVAWCRRLLGPDADAGAGPAVWREIAGPPTTVPPPAPAAPRPAPATRTPRYRTPRPRTRCRSPHRCPRPARRSRPPRAAHRPRAAARPRAAHGPRRGRRRDGRPAAARRRHLDRHGRRGPAGRPEPRPGHGRVRPLRRHRVRRSRPGVRRLLRDRGRFRPGGVARHGVRGGGRRRDRRGRRPPALRVRRARALALPRCGWTGRPRPTSPTWTCARTARATSASTALGPDAPWRATPPCSSCCTANRAPRTRPAGRPSTATGTTATVCRWRPRPRAARSACATGTGTSRCSCSP